MDAWQIFFARLKGADAILLIAAVLPNQDLRYLTKIAKSLGMASLIEVGVSALLDSLLNYPSHAVLYVQVHTEQEMDRVLGLEGVELIGINNRDLGSIPFPSYFGSILPPLGLSVMS